MTRTSQSAPTVPAAPATQRIDHSAARRVRSDKPPRRLLVAYSRRVARRRLLLRPRHGAWHRPYAPPGLRIGSLPPRIRLFRADRVPSGHAGPVASCPDNRCRVSRCRRATWESGRKSSWTARSSRRSSAAACSRSRSRTVTRRSGTPPAKMRRYRIRIAPGDKVKVEALAVRPTRGRIVYRER